MCACWLQKLSAPMLALDPAAAGSQSVLCKRVRHLAGSAPSVLPSDAGLPDSTAPAAPQVPPNIDSAPVPLVQAWPATRPRQRLQPTPTHLPRRPLPGGPLLVQREGLQAPAVPSNSSSPRLLLLLSVPPARPQPPNPC